MPPLLFRCLGWFLVSLVNSTELPSLEFLQAKFSETLAANQYLGWPTQRSLELEIAHSVQESRVPGVSPNFVTDDLLYGPLLDLVAEETPETEADRRCGSRAGTFACAQLGKAVDGVVEIGGDLANTTANRAIIADESSLGPATQLMFQFLRSKPWVAFLERVFGLSDLIPDPFMVGGGVHVTQPGGFLRLHADFNFNNVDESTVLHRRVNAFVYLNRAWQESYGGHLELWNRNLTQCGARVLPSFGRVVAFRSTDFSYHGFPHPLTSPPGRSRRSLALYYYTRDRAPNECLRGSCARKHRTLWDPVVECSRCRGPCCRQACPQGRSVR